MCKTGEEALQVHRGAVETEGVEVVDHPHQGGIGEAEAGPCRGLLVLVLDMHLLNTKLLLTS